VTENLYPCPFDTAVSCNMKICEYRFGEMLPKECINIEEFSMVTTPATTEAILCNHTGYYHIVTFLCFKRKFLACENCGKLIPQTKWRFSKIRDKEKL
jgi:hypothetical protein